MNRLTVIHFLLGVLSTMFGVAALFFLKFWRRTRDRLFLAFAAAFFIEGLTRLPLLVVDAPADTGPSIYVARLVGYLLVLAAIVQKNRGNGRS